MQIIESLLQAGADPSDVYSILDKKTLRQLNRARSSTVDVLVDGIVPGVLEDDISTHGSNHTDEELSYHDTTVSVHSVLEEIQPRTHEQNKLTLFNAASLSTSDFTVRFLCPGG
mgnify:CR=1 FL=1